MAEQQKSLEKKTDVQKKEFVKLSNLTEKEFKALPEMMVSLSKTTTRSGYERASIDFVLVKSLLEINLPISIDRYNLLRLKLGLPLTDDRGVEKRIYNVPVKFRYVKGESEFGEYKSIELIFKQYVYETYFFTKNYNQAEVFKTLEENGTLNINWFDRPEKLKDSEIINYTWEQ